jgi:hypothetical protein
MMPRPTMMMSWPSVLLPTIIVTVGTRGPLLDGPSVEAGSGAAPRHPGRRHYILARRVNHDTALSGGDLFPGHP